MVVAGLWTLREAIAGYVAIRRILLGARRRSRSRRARSRALFSWIGISGVSFVMVFLVALALECWELRSVPIQARGILLVGATALALIVPAFPIALKGTTTVAAVQGDGPAGYFDPHDYGDLLAAQFKATTPLFDSKRTIDMVIWPEGASDIDPVAADRAPDEDVAATEFNDVVRKLHAPLLAGTIQHRGSKYFNTSLLWEQGKGVVDHYDKKHPVPFGEYVPDRAFWRALAPSLIDLIGRDYTPGTTNTVFDVNGVIAGIDICFDITDDGVMRDSIRSGAQILIAQTNNADFGHTDESVQQLAIARIRAMELGRTPRERLDRRHDRDRAARRVDGGATAGLQAGNTGRHCSAEHDDHSGDLVWGQPYRAAAGAAGARVPWSVAMVGAREKAPVDSDWRSSAIDCAYAPILCSPRRARRNSRRSWSSSSSSARLRRSSSMSQWLRGALTSTCSVSTASPALSSNTPSWPLLGDSHTSGTSASAEKTTSNVFPSGVRYTLFFRGENSTPSSL